MRTHPLSFWLGFDKDTFVVSERAKIDRFRQFLSTWASSKIVTKLEEKDSKLFILDMSHVYWCSHLQSRLWPGYLNFEFKVIPERSDRVTWSIRSEHAQGICYSVSSRRKAKKLWVFSRNRPTYYKCNRTESFTIESQTSQIVYSTSKSTNQHSPKRANVVFSSFVQYLATKPSAIQNEVRCKLSQYHLERTKQIYNNQTWTVILSELLCFTM